MDSGKQGELVLLECEIKCMMRVCILGNRRVCDKQFGSVLIIFLKFVGLINVTIIVRFLILARSVKLSGKLCL